MSGPSCRRSRRWSETDGSSCKLIGQWPCNQTINDGMAAAVLFEVGSIIYGPALNLIAFIIGSSISGLDPGGMHAAQDCRLSSFSLIIPKYSQLVTVVYAVPLQGRPMYPGPLWIRTWDLLHGRPTSWLFFFPQAFPADGVSVSIFP